jgi:hypothetical protein
VTVLSRRLGDGWVLGLDQSYSGFGFVAMRADGHHVTALGRFPAEKSIGVDRLVEIECWLADQIVRSFPVLHVVMEGYAPSMTYGREMAGELGALVKLTLRRTLADKVSYPTVVQPDALKRFVSARTKSRKDDMKMEILDRWGVKFTDDNLADAYGLARIAAALQWPDQQKCTAGQLDLLAKLRQHTEHHDTDRPAGRPRRGGRGRKPANPGDDGGQSCEASA